MYAKCRINGQRQFLTRSLKVIINRFYFGRGWVKTNIEVHEMYKIYGKGSYFFN